MFGKIVVLAVALVAVGYVVSQHQPGATAAADAAPSLPMPGSEQAFISTVQNYAAQYGQAANEMAQGALRVRRAKALCALNTDVENWTGTVATLSSNSDGRGVLEIKLADGVTVGTWNNAISDIGSDTLIDPTSPVGTSAASMGVGAPVTFSGSLISADTDCFGEQSITQEGSMTGPEFTLQFSALSSYQPR